jgi:hypothetical protein
VTIVVLVHYGYGLRHTQVRRINQSPGVLGVYEGLVRTNNPY